MTPVWIHQWLRNDAKCLKSHRRGALLFFWVIHQISRSHRLKNRRFESNLSKITRPVAAIKSLRFALLKRYVELTRQKIESREWPDLLHRHTSRFASFREWSVVSAWLWFRTQLRNPCQPCSSALASTWWLYTGVYWSYSSFISKCLRTGQFRVVRDCSVAETPAKFESNWKTLITNLAPSETLQDLRINIFAHFTHWIDAGNVFQRNQCHLH